MPLHSTAKSPRGFVNIALALAIAAQVTPLRISPLALAAPQQSLLFRQSAEPTSFVIVFSANGSMASQLQEERQAVEPLLKAAVPGDEFALVEVHQDAKRSCAFTPDTAQILSVLAGVKASGGTALRDAIVRALGESKQARNARKGILIVANGNDNSSGISAAETIKAAGLAGVPIYAISLSYDQRGSNFLDELAVLSGGRHEFAKSNK